MSPYYDEDGITIYHGDCREVAPTLEYDVVVSDPPYGVSWNTDSTRFSGEMRRFTEGKSDWGDVRGDDEPFDPQPWLRHPAILWGANHFADRLPPSGGWLVWDKRKGLEDVAENGWPLSEAELAWSNVRGSVRVFRNQWMGVMRSGERGKFHHPTQKPIALMEWCMGFVPEGVVLDPYMGSGSTLIGARLAGRSAIGIEIEERYCEIAVQRLAQGILAFD